MTHRKSIKLNGGLHKRELVEYPTPAAGRRMMANSDNLDMSDEDTLSEDEMTIDEIRQIIRQVLNSTRR